MIPHKILIIEDEPLNANRVKRLLLDIDDTLEIEGPSTSVEEVIKLLSANSYDLILSDIRLHDRLVFEAFQEVMPSCPVIFTTAYDEYALKAFRNNGIDYLLKPIDYKELSDAYHKACLLGSSREATTKLQSVSRELKCYKERILVTRGDELVPLKVCDINYIHTEDNQVCAYTVNGERYHLALTMGELEEVLSPELFFRLNRQYIVHIDSIQKISFYFMGKLVVRIKGCNESPIVVSKGRSSDFREWLDR
jgi:DNA-binding LytR/AlgR family response regulator